MSDRDDAGTPGWRERLAAVARHLDAGLTNDEAVVTPYGPGGTTDMVAADIRTALAASRLPPPAYADAPDGSYVVDSLDSERVVRVAAPHRRPVIDHDDDLPGMWSTADYLGGDPDERSYAQRAADAVPVVPPPAGAQVDAEALVARLRDAFPAREFLWREGDTFGRLTPETLADLLAKAITDG